MKISLSFGEQKELSCQLMAKKDTSWIHDDTSSRKTTCHAGQASHVKRIEEAKLNKSAGGSSSIRFLLI